MQFSEIKKELGGVVFDTIRIDRDNYFEAVVVKNELVKLTTTLERIFGSPAWPSKDDLLPQVQDIIKDFGGIRAGQTLYFSKEGKDAVIAMLWPWQDGYHITLKIIRK